MRPTYSISQNEVSLSATHPVSVDFQEVNRDVLPHDHDYYEICLALKGGGEHRTAHYRKPLRRGSILVVPPGGVHSLRKGNGLRVVNIYYLAEWLLFDLRSLWDQNGVVPLFLSATLFGIRQQAPIPHFDLDEEALRLCTDEILHLEAELQCESPSIVFLKAAVLKLFIRVSRCFPDNNASELPDRFRPEIRQTLEIIEEGLMENQPPAPADLARRAGLSQDNLSRLFRESTGRTINDYYQRRRVHLACNLLLNPNASVTEVVYALGYADAAHFCRMFKRYTNLSPRSWRQQYLPHGKPRAGKANRG